MNTEKMKAAVWHKPMDLSVELVDRPAVGEGDVLVKVRACGICGSDLQFYKVGAHPECGIPVASGRVPGHEYVGDVVEVGHKVKDLKVGDRILTVGAFGAMAEYIKLAPDNMAVALGLVFKVPPEISDDEAATIEPLNTSLAGMEMGKPVSGETAVVMGLGPIGLGVVQCLKALTNTRVIAVGWQSEKRLALARQFGADAIVRASEVDAYEKVMELTGTIPVFGADKAAAAVDIVYECAGHPAKRRSTPAIQQGLWMLRPYTGRLVAIAAFEDRVELDLMPIIYKELKLFGSLVTPPDLIRHAIELVRTRTIDRQAMITHEFPLDKAREAFDVALDTRESVKVLIRS